MQVYKQQYLNPVQILSQREQTLVITSFLHQITR